MDAILSGLACSMPSSLQWNVTPLLVEVARHMRADCCPTFVDVVYQFPPSRHHPGRSMPCFSRLAVSLSSKCPPARGCAVHENAHRTGAHLWARTGRTAAQPSLTRRSSWPWVNSQSTKVGQQSARALELQRPNSAAFRWDDYRVESKVTVKEHYSSVQTQC
jgi:hypothetical protein